MLQLKIYQVNTYGLTNFNVVALEKVLYNTNVHLYVFIGLY